MRTGLPLVKKSLSFESDSRRVQASATPRCRVKFAGTYRKVCGLHANPSKRERGDDGCRTMQTSQKSATIGTRPWLSEARYSQWACGLWVCNVAGPGESISVKE